MDFRVERDSMGEVLVPSDKFWGAQTERSLENFKIGTDKMPIEVIRALAAIKLCAARVNRNMKGDKMPCDISEAITCAAGDVIEGKYDGHFPLSVFQTGSGTQTNMNVNEVIANRANAKLNANKVHPNDHVNMSQSSNDVFPAAMHISAVKSIEDSLFPALKKLTLAFKKLEDENRGIIKTGRTHLQDATPISFSDEVSGWRFSVEESYKQIELALSRVRALAIGGTAVGTGINAPHGFGEALSLELTKLLGTEFTSSENKFHSLTSKSELSFLHGALAALASDILKIANDVRLLSSGPRCGLGELSLPENEPGSSIMPGKVNPTQCEALTMVALEVMAADNLIKMASSQGNFELNVYMPVIIYNFLRSVRLLSDAINSFADNCVKGIKVNKDKMQENLERSLMTVTALNPYIGYDNSAKVAKLAFLENISLKEATLKLGLMSDKIFDYSKMV